MPLQQPLPDTCMARYLREKDKWGIEQHPWVFSHVHPHNIESGSQGDRKHHKRIEQRILNSGQDRIAFRHTRVEPFDVEPADPAIKIAITHQDCKTITTVVMEYFDQWLIDRLIPHFDQAETEIHILFGAQNLVETLRIFECFAFHTQT